MASNLNYKQVVNVTRRTWDREAYEARAQVRLKEEQASSSSSNKASGEKRPLQQQDGEEPLKEEFTPAAEGAAGPYKSKRAFLKARRDKVDLESKVGTSEIVSAEAVATSSTTDKVSPTDGVTKTGVGWHCKVCDCFLKDSLTYLDHINGRKHQRNLGYSMRVEQSTKDQVVAKLTELAEKDKKKDEEPEIETSLEDIVKAKDNEARKRKEERARKREERKKRLQEEQEEEEAEAMDPAMAAMMGFSGFGGSNKNR